MLKKLRQLFQSLFQKTSSAPVTGYVVLLSDEALSCRFPDGNIEKMLWKDIETISLKTTDQGPLQPDVWFVLQGAGEICVFPQEAKNADNAYERLSEFDGFDFETFIDAMSSTKNATFLLWKRK